MAKRGKRGVKRGKQARWDIKAAPASEVTFSMPTLRSVVDMLKGRKGIAEAVVKALESGRGEAVKDPGIGGSALVQARQVVKGLKDAIAAIQTTCPNPLDSSFVIKFDDSRGTSYRKRR